MKIKRGYTVKMRCAVAVSQQKHVLKLTQIYFYTGFI